MSTESEVKLERYRKIEREADEFGRIIGVRRLRPSEQTKLVGMTDDLPGFDVTDMVDDEGNIRKFEVPHRGPLIIAASVCEIDDAKIMFPKTRAILDSIYDRLDAEGLAAAVKALTRLNAAAGPVVDQKDVAKN
jgi:hypothetical protein